jgi:hypothetical protein
MGEGTAGGLGSGAMAGINDSSPELVVTAF